MSKIDPVQKCVLVETKGRYENLEVADERFGTSKMRGTVRAIAADIKEECKKLNIKVGDTVYFGKYEDMATVGADEDQILIKLEEIRGRSDAD